MTVRGLDTPEVRKRVAAILAQTSKRDIGPAARSLAGRVLTVRLTVQSGQPRLKETIRAADARGKSVHRPHDKERDL